MKQVIAKCPICAKDLVISRLSCSACDTRIETTLAFAGFMKLPADLQDFVLVFLKCRGNIREVEKELGVSYPTVCKRLDMVNELLAQREEEKGTRRALGRSEILAKLERGEMSAKEAAELLKGR